MKRNLDVPATASAVNAALKRAGREERICAGKGYVYFHSGEAFSWYTSSIPVCYVRDLTVREALRYVETMSADWQNGYDVKPIKLDWTKVEG